MCIASNLATKCLKTIYFSDSILQFRKLFTNKNFRQSFSTECFDHFDEDVIQMLQKRNYLQLDSDNSSRNIGILGQETINNWKSEWWRSFVIGKSNMIGIEEKKCSTSEINDHNICTDIIFKHLIKENSLDKAKLPFCVAATVVEQRDNCTCLENLVQVMFVHKSSELDAETWHSENMKWIKTYLRKPARLKSKFGEKSLTDVFMKKDILTYYSHDRTSCLVQTASLFTPECFTQHSDWDAISKMFESTPSVVVIRHGLLNLLAATLFDAYHIVSFPNYRHRMMRIHPYLAPVKAAVCIEGEKCVKLKQLASELTLLIRSMNASCWNADEEGFNYSNLDDSGVVHGVVINQETLENGLLFIRNRDSSLKVQAHISELEEKLFLYLNPK